MIEKLRAYNLQDEGLDTYEANEALGHQRDARRFDIAGSMLEHLGWTTVRLLTNNPGKVKGLQDVGIEVVEVVAIEMEANEHNSNYLAAKAKEVQKFQKGRESSEYRKDSSHDEDTGFTILDLARSADYMESACIHSMQTMAPMVPTA